MQRIYQILVGVKVLVLIDLVLLEANPLDDIANTRKIAAIVTDGRYLSQQDLTRLRIKLKQLAATK